MEEGRSPIIAEASREGGLKVTPSMTGHMRPFCDPSRTLRSLRSPTIRTSAPTTSKHCLSNTPSKETIKTKSIILISLLALFYYLFIFYDYFIIQPKVLFESKKHFVELKEILFGPPILKIGLFVPVERVESCRCQTIGDRGLRIWGAGVKVYFYARHWHGLECS